MSAFSCFRRGPHSLGLLWGDAASPYSGHQCMLPSQKLKSHDLHASYGLIRLTMRWYHPQDLTASSPKLMLGVFYRYLKVEGAHSDLKVMILSISMPECSWSDHSRSGHKSSERMVKSYPNHLRTLQWGHLTHYWGRSIDVWSPQMLIPSP